VGRLRIPPEPLATGNDRFHWLLHRLRLSNQFLSQSSALSRSWIVVVSTYFRSFHYTTKKQSLVYGISYPVQLLNNAVLTENITTAV